MFFCTKDTGESNNGEADSNVSRPVLKKKNTYIERYATFLKRKKYSLKVSQSLGGTVWKIRF